MEAGVLTPHSNAARVEKDGRFLKVTLGILHVKTIFRICHFNKFDF